MPSLHELQCNFSAALLARDPARLSADLVAGGAAAHERIDIYVNNLHHNAREALRAVYPVVEQLVGEAFFNYAADQYLLAYPSTSGDIQQYGGNLATFLAQFGPAASLRYLPDVARLEWLMHEVFHAADHGPLAIERLAAIAQADCTTLRFILNPASRLLVSAFPVSRIWQANQPDAQDSQDIDADSGGVQLLVRRSGYAVEMLPLGAAEFAMLQALVDGETVEQAYECALRVAPAFALAAFIRQRIMDATIIGFETESSGVNRIG